MKNAPDLDKNKAALVHKGFQKTASLTPESVARKSLRAFTRRKPKLVLGIDAKILLLLKKAAGRHANKLIKALFQSRPKCLLK